MKIPTLVALAALPLLSAGAHSDPNSRYNHLLCVETNDSAEGGGFDVSYCLNARNKCPFGVTVTGRDAVTGMRRTTDPIAPGQDGQVCFSHRFNILEYTEL